MKSARGGEFRIKYKILNSYDEHIRQFLDLSDVGPV
jgi:hypothetical protein